MNEPRINDRFKVSTISAIMVAILGLYAASTERGADLLLTTVEGRRHLHEGGQESAIVLLTGNHPGRIPAAAELQRETQLPLIVAGRNAGYYFKKLREAGAQQLWSESNSTNTEQNAAYSACLLNRINFHHVFVVTDTAHMLRALVWFRYYGLDPSPVRAGPPWPGHSTNPFVPSSIGWSRSMAVLHEWGGLIYYSLRKLTGQRLACPESAQLDELSAQLDELSARSPNIVGT